ncbi:hypothetical protein ACFFKC_09895 [Pseudoduganella danionis]|uniref:Resolvase n=1 Tax=Pseudoduganella danionis TaxID=1890295 RepID=A0ABW9SPL9_9BURK|nr:hypothetical protein [Pseudoduganella danionis]MTW32664.1 hypothetical protein [Pseudoduganella danionis]
MEKDKFSSLSERWDRAINAELSPERIRELELARGLLVQDLDTAIRSLAYADAYWNAMLNMVGSLLEDLSAEKDHSSIALGLLTELKPTLERGKRVRDGALKGNKAKYGTKEDKQKTREEYQIEANRIADQNPRMSWNAICERVGVKFNVGGKTIYRKTTNPRRK